MLTKRTFTRDELLALGLPYCFKRKGDGVQATVVSDTMIDQRRWTVEHELIFQLPDQPEDQAWLVYYQEGATECQDDTDPWYDEATVEATLMVLRPVTQMKWLEASEANS